MRQHTFSRGKSRRRWVWTAGVGVVLLLAGQGLAWRWKLEAPRPPLGLPEIPWPEHNPYSREKAHLGRLLFFDKRLSSDGTIACAGCHDPARAFSDRVAVSEGIHKRKGRRNASTLINRAYSEEQFWDARSPSLEEQAIAPIANPDEMTTAATPAEAHRTCVQRLAAVPGYRTLFRRAFGDENVTAERVGRALATFERTLLSGNSPYDRYQAGNTAALSPAQVRGKELFFGRANCFACHSGPNFTDEIPANTGVGQGRPQADRGRVEITHQEWETGFFKPPSLREVALTGPYMHDGSVKTLNDAVEHYNKGGGKNPYLDERLSKLHLTAAEKQDLVEFLRALSGEGWQHAQAPAPEMLP